MSLTRTQTQIQTYLMYRTVVRARGTAALYVCGLALALLYLALATPAQAATCNIYSAATGAPSGYGASYNVFKTSEMMVSIACNEDKSITVTSGNNDPLTYIYKEGYYYNPTAKSWTNFTYSCDNMIANAWCVGQVNKTLTDVPTDANNFLVSFTCQWSGSKWNCGCSNTSCSTAKWQIQGWKVAQSGGGGGTIDPNAEGVIVFDDVNSAPLGSYSKSEVSKKWGKTISNVLPSGMKVVNDPDSSGSHGRVLEAFFKKGVAGYKPANGGQWIKEVNDYDELYLAYDVYFQPGFDFVKGGKLGPSFRSTNWIDKYSNGKPAGTKADGTDFWSVAMGFYIDGVLDTYAYHANGPSKWGHHLKWDDAGGKTTVIATGRWHTIELYLKLNTPGKLDGRVQGWWNGEKRLDRSDLMLRKPGGEHLKIGGIMFYTFMGGSGPAAAPPHDQRMYYDNFVVSTNPITH